jgi:hypothetical protein
MLNQIERAERSGAIVLSVAQQVEDRIPQADSRYFDATNKAPRGNKIKAHCIWSEIDRRPRALRSEEVVHGREAIRFGDAV